MAGTADNVGFDEVESPALRRALRIGEIPVLISRIRENHPSQSVRTLIEYWPKVATTSENFEAGSFFRIPSHRNGKLELIKR